MISKLVGTLLEGQESWTLTSVFSYAPSLDHMYDVVKDMHFNTGPNHCKLSEWIHLW